MVSIVNERNVLFSNRNLAKTGEKKTKQGAMFNCRAIAHSAFFAFLKLTSDEGSNALIIHDAIFLLSLRHSFCLLDFTFSPTVCVRV